MILSNSLANFVKNNFLKYMYTLQDIFQGGYIYILFAFYRLITCYSHNLCERSAQFLSHLSPLLKAVRHYQGYHIYSTHSTHIICVHIVHDLHQISSANTYNVQTSRLDIQQIKIKNTTRFHVNSNYKNTIKINENAIKYFRDK